MKTNTIIGVGIVSLGLMACSSSPSASPSANGSENDSTFTVAESGPAPKSELQTIRSFGVVDYRALAATKKVTAPGGDPLHAAKLHATVDKLTERAPAATPPTNPPTVTPANVGGADRALYGFPGMGIVDTDQATGTQAITPPDQGLCAGNGFIVEAVNSAVAIYDILGQPVTAPVDAAKFFQFPADAAGNESIPSDPKCYFDQASQRFFATILRIPYDANGNMLGSQLAIAVSQSNDPTQTWNVYEIELTDDGTNGSPKHAHCPCLGDQPLIGADANGFYVSTNEFGLSTTSPGYNGAQIYAISKKALIGGKLPSAIAHLSSLVLADGIGYSVQPATSPSGLVDAASGGSEYFLSSLDFAGSLDNRIAVWSLTNTKSLDDATPSVKLSHAVLSSEAYGFPPPAQQMAGPTPLATCLTAGTCSQTTAKGVNTEEQVDTNDDRMNQVVYAGGKLWGALNTIVNVGGAQRAGIAWFSVQAKQLASGQLGAKMDSQGYVAVANADVMFPSIALTDDGRGAMAFEIAGDAYFPSAAYARMSKKGPGDVRIAGAGAGPLDNWDGYAPFAGETTGPARFGDYSAALVDGDTLWMAAEWVPASCAAFPCGGRDPWANWGTFVSRIDLDDTNDQ